MKKTKSKQPSAFPFTVRAIETLPAHDKDSRSAEQEYSDTECRGLKLSVSKNGRKFFSHRYTVKRGKTSLRRVFRIGEFPYVTLKEARQIVTEHKVFLNKGIDPHDDRLKESKAITFNEFFETKYMPDHAKPNKRSWKDDQRMYDYHIKDAFKGLMLSEVSRHDIVRLLNIISVQSSKPRANRYLSLISKVLATAIEWDFLEGINPCRGIRKFPENGGRTRYLNSDEISRLKTALSEAKHRVSAHAIWFLLTTGCRVGEAMKLTWDMVDMKEKIAFLPKENTKSGKPRPVYLNDQALKTLKQLKKLKKSDNPYVFPGETMGSHLTTPRRTFETAKTKAGIKDCRLHDLRHTFASIAIQAGDTSIYTVKELLGHSTIEMTMRYAHLKPKTLTQATDSVASKLSDILA